MGNVYVLGAGFSKTCDIATDYEMLDALNPLLAATKDKSGVVDTCIDSLRKQNFPKQKILSFEAFMSTLSALKVLPEFIGTEPNVFASEEKEIHRVLKRYLKNMMKTIQWETNGNVILDFVKRVNWQRDEIITFNYDLLVETAIERSGIGIAAKVIHLHGSIADDTLVYPTYKKLAYRNTRTKVAMQWKKAFELLMTTRRKEPLERLFFIGYSMPPSDLEARGLFNYTDWYNFNHHQLALSNKLVSSMDKDRLYAYEVIVINPSPGIQSQYSFFRKDLIFHCSTLADWL